MIVSWASICSRLGRKIDTQIEGVGGGNKTPEMFLKPFGRFWGAISGTGN